MSDRNNYGFKQLVTEGELDGSFDDLENAERNLAIEAGAAQDSSEPSHFGGIGVGLVVTLGSGGDDVDVSIGAARDEQGRRSPLGSVATVKMTHTGDTPEGDISDAVGDGADITGSCGSSQLIIATLSIVYDEHLSDQRQDGALANYYFDIAESFHFNIDIGVAFANPPTSQPSRCTLNTGRVVLTDMVLLNSAGSMTVLAICPSSAEWYALGDILGVTHFDGLDGRRADVASLDDATDFPAWRITEGHNGFNFRGSTRKALYDLAKQLGNNVAAVADPDGASLIGVDTRVGTETLTAYDLLSLTRTNLRASLGSLLDEVNKKRSRGPDMREPFTDDFTHKPTAAGGAWDPDTDSDVWCTTGVTLGSIGFSSSYHGGVLALLTGAGINDFTGIHTTYDAATGSICTWRVDGSYGARCQMRIMIPQLTDLEVFIRFVCPGAATEASLKIDDTGAVKPFATVIGAGSTLVTMSTLIWYEFELLAQGTTCKITDLSTGLSESVVYTPGNLAYFTLGVRSQAAGTGAAVGLYVDVVSISDVKLR